MAREGQRQIRPRRRACRRRVGEVRQKYRSQASRTVRRFCIMGTFVEKYSSEIMILLLVAMVMATLLALVPLLLRAHRRNQEEKHTERMQALERGLPLPSDDSRTRAAGRTAAL